MAQAGSQGAAHGVKTPVTIITGFLGAGKTTLLNYILRNREERNISVIENEFGEVNIDNELVAEALIEKEDLVSLDNGCVCCSLRKDIVKALAELERRSRHRNKRVDHVILETTGLADPAPVAFTFFANPWIASRFRLDSIVCVVDTRYVLQHLLMEESEGINETGQQLAFSDLILLNKTDLVTEEQLEKVKQQVRRINTTARLVECRLNTDGGRPPLNELLNSHAFSVDKALQVDASFMDSDSGSDCDEADSDSEDEDSTQGPSMQQEQQTTGTTGTEQRSTADKGDAGSVAQASGSGAAAENAGDAGASSAGPSSGKESGTAYGPGASSSGQKRKEVGSAVVGQKRGSEVTEWLAKSKRRHVDEHCGDNCEECDIKTGQIQMKERQPKRRRKQLHDLCGVGSVGIVARGPLDEYRFNMFMRDLLAEKAKDIFRCKGVLAVHGYGNRKFVFQGVHETICYGPSDKPWTEDEPRINQIVFIGKDLDRKALMNGFRTCVWTPLPEGWKEAHDQISGQPYYYNPTTGQKTWARPVEARPAPNTVTATRIFSTEQPRNLQPSMRRRSATLGEMQQQQLSGPARPAMPSVDSAAGLSAAAAGVAPAQATSVQQQQQQPGQQQVAPAVAVQAVTR